jgi:hypothetical protein
VYQCWWRICRELNVFFHVPISHVLRFISICDPLTDLVPRCLEFDGCAWMERLDVSTAAMRLVLTQTLRTGVQGTEVWCGCFG